MRPPMIASASKPPTTPSPRRDGKWGNYRSKLDRDGPPAIAPTLDFFPGLLLVWVAEGSRVPLWVWICEPVATVPVLVAALSAVDSGASEKA